MAHGDHPNFIAVFLTKERLSSQCARIVRRHNARLDRAVLADETIHFALDLFDLRGRERVPMAEIKPQTVICIKRPALRHMRAQCAAQSLVQKMGSGVICPNARAALRCDRKLRSLPQFNKALGDLCHMDEQIRSFPAISDLQSSAFCDNHPAVTDLTTAFRIEGCLVEHDLRRRPLLNTVHLATILHKCNNLPLGLFGVIAQKICRAVTVEHIKPNRIIRHFA